jgi:leucyl-tRNA---protein transferase
MSNLQTLVFYATPEHDCSYLDGELATTMFVDPKAEITLPIYNQLSNLGFRRSGTHYYRPHCGTCKACTPIRVIASQFKPSRSQKRLLKNNKGIEWQYQTPDFHEDQYLLYEKYINARHADGDMFPPSREQYRSFLVEGHSSTRFVEFSRQGQILAIAVVDQLPDGLSAIYTFFDPEYEHMSLGKYIVLWQIQEAQRLKLPFVYLGYFIANCQKMSYKTDFKPFEAFIEDRWLDQQSMLEIVNQSP